MKKYLKLLAFALAVCMAFGVAAACVKRIDDPANDPNKIKVTFDLNYPGAPAAPAPIYVEIGGKWPELPVPAARAGYTFGGWSFGSVVTSINKVKPGDDIEDAADLTLYAWWTGNQYRITFDLEDAKVTDLNSKVGVVQDSETGEIYRMAEYGKPYGSAPIAEKKSPSDPSVYLNFVCWYIPGETEEQNIELLSNSGMMGSIDSVVELVGNHTLKARWVEPAIVLDFSDESDMQYFKIRTHGGGGGERDIVYDAEKQALKVINTPITSTYANECYVPCVLPLPKGYKVTVEMSVEFAPGKKMDGKMYVMMHLFDVLIPGSMKFVSPVNDNWPGIVTISATMPETAAPPNYPLYIFFGAVGNNDGGDGISFDNINNAFFYIHKLTVSPPKAPKTSLTFDDASDMEYFGEQTISEGGDNPAVTYDSVRKALKVVNTDGSSQLFIPFFNPSIVSGCTVSFTAYVQFADSASFGVMYVRIDANNEVYIDFDDYVEFYTPRTAWSAPKTKVPVTITNPSAPIYFCIGDTGSGRVDKKALTGATYWIDSVTITYPE